MKILLSFIMLLLLLAQANAQEFKLIDFNKKPSSFYTFSRPLTYEEEQDLVFKQKITRAFFNMIQSVEFETTIRSVQDDQGEKNASIMPGVAITGSLFKGYYQFENWEELPMILLPYEVKVQADGRTHISLGFADAFMINKKKNHIPFGIDILKLEYDKDYTYDSEEELVLNYIKPQININFLRQENKVLIFHGSASVGKYLHKAIRGTELKGLDGSDRAKSSRLTAGFAYHSKKLSLGFKVSFNRAIIEDHWTEDLEQRQQDDIAHNEYFDGIWNDLVQDWRDEKDQWEDDNQIPGDLTDSSYIDLSGNELPAYPAQFYYTNTKNYQMKTEIRSFESNVFARYKLMSLKGPRGPMELYLEGNYNQTIFREIISTPAGGAGYTRVLDSDLFNSDFRNGTLVNFSAKLVF
ncbi:hypothetical protein N9N67_00195 [Bacteriovoracaceae bacterium]|nr:hypothetical protein [Bacteriovoracaceae bacterium]